MVTAYLPSGTGLELARIDKDWRRKWRGTGKGSRLVVAGGTGGVRISTDVRVFERCTGVSASLSSTFTRLGLPALFLFVSTMLAAKHMALHGVKIDVLNVHEELKL